MNSRWYAATHCLVATVIALAPACALAQRAVASPEHEFMSVLPVVLTPSRLPQPLNEAPAAVTVIDRELIRATGYRDLARLFRLVPGMQIGQERGNSHWVTYHGMGNDNPSWMQVLVDGRSVYSPGYFDGVDWNALPLNIDEIERIEIVRGTNSVAYGSNALLGVINIITRHSADTSGPRVSTHLGGSGIRDLQAEFGGTSDDGGWRFNGTARRDDGFAGLHDGRSARIASFRADRSIGDRDELTVRFALSDGGRELGYPDSTFNNNGERDARFDNGSLHLQWRHTPTVSEEWLLHYYRNQERTAEAWTAAAQIGPLRAVVPLDRNRRSTRDSIELQHRTTPSATTRAVWGLELRRDQIDAPFLYFGAAHQQSDLRRLFGEAEWWARPDLSLNGSALVEKFDSDATRLSPRLFANWKANPDMTLRAGYARAWRQPFLFERYGDVRAHFRGVLLVHPYLPHPDLKASRLDNWELGLVGRARALDAHIDVRLFRERISGFVTRVSHPEDTAPLLAATLPSARYENLATPVTLSGLEYQVDSRFAPSARVLFNHALIARRSQSSLERKLTAPYTASLTWLQDWGGNWSSTMTLLRMGSIAGGSGFVAQSDYSAPPYTTLDARIARRLNFGERSAEIALVATNLGPRHQEIPDRSEQFLHGNDPVNRSSRAVWLTLSLDERRP